MPLLARFSMFCANTSPCYQVSVFSTIGPCAFYFSHDEDLICSLQATQRILYNKATRDLMKSHGMSSNQRYARLYW